MILSEKDIRDWVQNDAVFFRGKEYWLEKRVKAYEQITANRISARVIGTETYKVEIKFDRGDISSQCDCPYDWGTCKHVVAVLLRWAHENALSALTDFPAKASPSKILPSEKRLIDIEQLLSQVSLETIRVRLELTSISTLNFANKGTKARVKFVDDQGQIIYEMTYLRDFVDQSMSRDRNAQWWDRLNDSQQYFLNLVASFQQPYQEIFLKPFQLSLVLNACAGLDGVELYAGVKRPIEVCHDKIQEVRMVLGFTKKRELTAALEFSNPQDETQLYYPSIIEGRPMWCYLQEQAKFLRLPQGLDQSVLRVLGCNAPMIFKTQEIPRILKIAKILKTNHCIVRYDSPELEEIQSAEVKARVVLAVDYDGKDLSVRPRAVYGEVSLPLSKLLDRQEFTLMEMQGKLKSIQRDLAKEGEILRFLLKDCFLQPSQDGEALITSNKDQMAQVLYEELPKIADRSAIDISEQVKNIFHFNEVLEPFIRVGDGQGMNWFDYDIGFTLGGKKEEIAFKEIQRQLRHGKKYMRLDSGEFVRISPENYQPLDEFIKEYGNAGARLSGAHLPSLLSSGKEGRLPVHLGPRAKELCEKLKQFQSIARTDVPSIFKGVLRDYQVLGLDWLEFLREFQFGGILADDMGLGKTIQVLALLSKCRQQGVKSPSLVVCPTTLVLNWQAEIKKFAPDLKVLAVAGKDRRAFLKEMDGHDLVLTSYALLRRDAALYDKQEFYYVILDEAQHIKNRHTLNARTAKVLHSVHRLVLTGTPIENSIADLWSIFDFLMPGYLGPYEAFRDFYELPIIAGKDQSRLERLSKKIKPFLLRRLKKDVIKELPPKIEQVSLCEMGPVQKRAYAAMADMARQKVMDAFKNKGFNKSRMLILTVLLRLRQICCHPRLAGVTQGSKFSVSAKLNLLKELLDEALDAGHRVLVFSQFIEMLDIIGEYLTKEKITFERLDGKSRDRGMIIDRFNQGHAQVFLLSLKVGGVGLNLTGADTVILFEPWWNPAVEDQAIDRAHRIGQNKQVMAYKLICQGTLEEKILELQKRKKNLVDSLIISEASMGKTLGWEDVKFLLDL